MANRATIFNGALRICRRARESDPDDPGKAHLVELRDVEREARRTVLKASFWNFADKRVALDPLEETADDWDYVYAVPSDLVRMKSVGTSLSDYDRADYVIRGDNIYTNLKNAVAYYTFDQTDYGFWPEEVAAAMSAKMAFLAGPVISAETAVSGILQEARLRYQESINLAKMANTNQRRYSHRERHRGMQDSRSF